MGYVKLDPVIAQESVGLDILARAPLARLVVTLAVTVETVVEVGIRGVCTIALMGRLPCRVLAHRGTALTMGHSAQLEVQVTITIANVVVYHSDQQYRRIDTSELYSCPIRDEI